MTRPASTPKDDGQPKAGTAQPSLSAVPGDAISQSPEFVRADEVRHVVETAISTLAGALDGLPSSIVHGCGISPDHAVTIGELVSKMRADVVAKLSTLLAPEPDPFA